MAFCWHPRLTWARLLFPYILIKSKADEDGKLCPLCFAAETSGLLRASRSLLPLVCLSSFAIVHFNLQQKLAPRQQRSENWRFHLLSCTLHFYKPFPPWLHHSHRLEMEQKEASVSVTPLMQGRTNPSRCASTSTASVTEVATVGLWSRLLSLLSFRSASAWPALASASLRLSASVWPWPRPGWNTNTTAGTTTGQRCRLTQELRMAGLHLLQRSFLKINNAV